MAQKISDRSFWAGKGANGSVFPMGAKTKNESSAEGAGDLSRYEDTTEAIKSQQMMSKAKTKAYPTKPGYRN